MDMFGDYSGDIGQGSGKNPTTEHESDVLETLQETSKYIFFYCKSEL